jgi:hypothetical protein
MAVYFAMRMEIGKLDYLAVFTKQAYKPFQEDTDLILIADGFQNLIVPIV